MPPRTIRKSKKGQLLLQYLEGVSWRTLEAYPAIIKELIRRKGGVYALYRKDKLYYVGLASNLSGRLKAHLKDRHHGRWDRFNVYLTSNDEHMKDLESLILRIASPAGNRVTGKFRRSDNLHMVLNRMMADSDADQRAQLLGGQVARRRRRIKTSRQKGTKGLAGVVERRMSLSATHKGQSYRATLRKDGLINYDGTRYESPTAAAKAVTGRAINGWSFWKYRDKKCVWVPLKHLRK
jgi:hypothetical protein